MPPIKTSLKVITLLISVLLIAATACGRHGADDARTSGIAQGKQASLSASSKTASVIPSAQRLVARDAGIALSAGGYTLSWKYENPGDYSQDGIVGLEDLAPLTEHFNEAATPANEWIDGSGDGAIGVADITPIAMNWGSEVPGYRIDGAETTEGLWNEVASLTLDDVDDTNGRLAFTNEIAPGFIYYRIVTLTPDGDAAFSDTLIAPSNEPIIYGVSPLSGYQHEEYTFSATASGQEPLTYSWDFGGGASPNTSSDISPTVTLSDAGEYSATLTISNSYGPTTYPFILTISARDTWAHTWGGSKDDVATGIALDSQGNVYLAGFTPSFGAGESDILLLKYTPDGELVFAQTWGGEGADASWEQGKVSIAIDAADNVYIASETDSFGQEQGIYDSLLLKFDTEGNLIWARIWGGDWIEHVCGVGVDAEGNVYVAGYRALQAFASWDIFTLKYNIDGELQHAVTWDSGQMDQTSALAVTPDGTCYVAGNINDVDANGNKALVLSFNQGGVLLWACTWGTKGRYDRIEGVTLGADGLLRCIGYNKNNGYCAPLLLAFNENGELEQSALINPGLSAIASSIANNGTGSLLLSGIITSETGERGDAFFISCSADGDIQYASSWSLIEDKYECANAITVDYDENLYLACVAANSSGTWRQLQGTTNAAIGVLSPLDGETAMLSGSETIPEGIITRPEGTQDTGGGGYYGYDALILKNPPS